MGLGDRPRHGQGRPDRPAAGARVPDRRDGGDELARPLGELSPAVRIAHRGPARRARVARGRPVAPVRDRGERSVGDAGLADRSRVLADGAVRAGRRRCRPARTAAGREPGSAAARLLALPRALVHHKLYEALEPTPDEHAARLDELLALAASDDPAVVAFAAARAGQARAGEAAPGRTRCSRRSRPRCSCRSRDTPSRAVKLAGRVLKRSPEHAPVAVGLLVDALAHEAREVQEAALDVVEAHRDAADRRRTRPARRAGRRGRSERCADACRRSPAPARSRRPTRRRRSPCPVGAARSPMRLADRAELEPVRDARRSARPRRRRARARRSGRARAGARRRSRGCAERPVDPGAGAGAGRAGGGARDAVAGRGRLPPRARRAGRRPAALARRARAPAAAPGGHGRRARARRSPRGCASCSASCPAGARGALLSAPTHRGGWIEPAVAVRRVAALDGTRPPVMDLAQMVLRLRAGRARPGGGRAARRRGGGGARARARRERAAPAARDRLGAAWDAAEHARDPAAFAAARLRPGRRQPAFEEPLPRRQRTARARPARRRCSPAGEAWWGWDAGRHRALADDGVAGQPGGRLPDASCGGCGSTTGTREYGIGEVLEVLLDPSEPIGEQAALAVALGLGTADAADRTLAADVTIAALTSRRLDGDGARRAARAAAARAAASSYRRAGRASLGDVAAAGPLAAHDVQAALEVVLAVATDDDRRRLLGVVELLRRLAVGGRRRRQPTRGRAPGSRRSRRAPRAGRRHARRSRSPATARPAAARPRPRFHDRAA